MLQLILDLIQRLLEDGLGDGVEEFLDVASGFGGGGDKGDVGFGGGVGWWSDI